MSSQSLRFQSYRRPCQDVRPNEVKTSAQDPVAVDAAPGGLLRRAFAQALDLGLAAALVQGLVALAQRLDPAPWGAWLGLPGGLRWSLSLALPVWFILSVLEWLPGQASPGKRTLGLRLLGHRQERLSFVRVALRTAIKLLPWIIGALALWLPKPWDPQERLELGRLLLVLGSNLWLGLYLACAAMTRRRQSLHDLVVASVVLRKPSKA